MELLMATAAEAADMLGVGCSSIAAKPLGSIKIGRSRRVSVASIRHVTAASAGGGTCRAEDGAIRRIGDAGGVGGGGRCAPGMTRYGRQRMSPRS